MTEQEIAIKLNDHYHEIASLKHRVTDVEKRQEDFIKLSRNVERLATNMELMLKEQQKQREELNGLRDAPAEEYKYYKHIIWGCIITGIVGAVIGAVLATVIHI